MSQAGKLNDLTPPPGTTLFIEGDTGGQIGPDGTGTIYLLGGPNISVDGNAGINTLVINADGISSTVTTVDATPTLIDTLAISAGYAYKVDCSFVALENDQSTALGGSAFTVVRNAGGGAQLSGGGHQNIIYNTPGNPEVTFAVAANNLEIYVTGAAATTLSWQMFIKYIQVT